MIIELVLFGLIGNKWYTHPTVHKISSLPVIFFFFFAPWDEMFTNFISFSNLQTDFQMFFLFVCLFFPSSKTTGFQSRFEARERRWARDWRVTLRAWGNLTSLDGSLAALHDRDIWNVFSRSDSFSVFWHLHALSRNVTPWNLRVG